jgi:CO/xanthine dehydrogenase Mo-binding subunit
VERPASVGQGSNTVLAQIAAEVLGIRYEDIKVNEGVDTDLTPIDPGSYSSRVTFYAGNAVKKRQKI